MERMPRIEGPSKLPSSFPLTPLPNTGGGGRVKVLSGQLLWGKRGCLAACLLTSKCVDAARTLFRNRIGISVEAWVNSQKEDLELQLIKGLCLR